MADKKISQLSAASTPLAGTEVLPIVQSGSTVKVSSDNLTVKNIRSNATTGILQVAGPGAGATRTMTTPDANFTAARTDAAQTFTGNQTIASGSLNLTSSAVNSNIYQGTGWVWTSDGTVSGTIRGGLFANSAGLMSIFGGATPSTQIGIDSVGDVGVGLSPSTNSLAGSGYKFVEVGSAGVGVFGGGGENYLVDNAYYDGAFKYSAAGFASYYYQSKGNGGHKWYSAPSGSAGASISFTETMDLSQAGNLTVKTGNIVQGTAAKGIDFSANTGAAGKTSSLLNWYEEGTFTPTIEGSSTAGTASYTVQTGAYTRIGRLVYFQIYLVWASGTGTGDLRVGGIPFNSASSSLAFGGAYAPLFTTVALTASNYSVGAYILSGNSKLVFLQTPVGGGAASNVAYDAAGEMMLIGQYFA